MATLGELRRAIFPAARAVGVGGLRGSRADREVSWVRLLRSRVPAFDALEAGDLAIIPGPALAVVAPGRAQTEELAAALVGARLPGVLLVEGDDGSDLLAALGEAASGAGVTVLRLAGADPVALERSVIRFLVNHRAELERRAAELEAQLTRLALRGRGLDVQAAAIGAFVGRAVVIEGRRGDRLAVHAPAGLAGAAAAVGRYAARPSVAALRVAIPSPGGEGGNGGRLVFLGDDPATELDRVAAERIVAVLALELARDEAVRQAREESRRGDPLPADGPPWVVLFARQAAASGADDPSTRAGIRAELRLIAPPARLALRGTTESLELRLVAAAPADDSGALELAGRIAGFLRRTVAVSRPFDEPGGRPAAEAAARTTLEAAERLDDPPPIALEARLAAYRLLGGLRTLPDGPRQARDLLAPLLTGRADRDRARLATLRAILDAPTAGEAASRLGVHRNTIGYRIARLEAEMGWDLRDPDLRMALGLAVRIVQTD